MQIIDNKALRLRLRDPDKVKRINKPYARKIQILTVVEQRAKVAGKPRQAAIAKRAKQELRAKHEAKKGATKKK